MNQQVMYKGTLICLSDKFSAETLYDILKESEKPTTKETLPGNTFIQIWRRDQKLTVQHYQTSFIRNVNEPALSEKVREKKKSHNQKHEYLKGNTAYIYLDVKSLSVISFASVFFPIQ